MAKYRKKPVVIEAEVFEPGMEDGYDVSLPDGVECEGWPWFDEVTKASGGEGFINGPAKIYPYINTLEGKHYISKGDYIITGVKGERYPCKPDIFKATYEPA